MATRSRLLTRSHIQNTRNTLKKVNVVLLDINKNYPLISNPKIDVKIFNKNGIDTCIDYITSETTDKYLFISVLIGSTVSPLISDFPQIISIYIYCEDQLYRNPPNQQIKLRGIFNSIEMMFKQFQEDIIFLTTEQYFEQSTFQNINQESNEVVRWEFYNSIEIQILIRMSLLHFVEKVIQTTDVC